MFRLLIFIFFSCVLFCSFSAPFSLCFEDRIAAVVMKALKVTNTVSTDEGNEYISYICSTIHNQSIKSNEMAASNYTRSKKITTKDTWIKINDRIEQKEYKKRNEYREHVATVRIAQKETQSEKNNFISIQMADALLRVQLFLFFSLSPSLTLSFPLSPAVSAPETLVELLLYSMTDDD